MAAPKRPKKWIQGAFNPDTEGDFAAKAKAAGMTTRQYAQHVLREGSQASDKTKQQANFALTLMKMNKKRRK